jgi:prolyl-tRNA synthetase
MKLSQLFTKTKKNIPNGEVSKNAQLLIRAGYIHKEMAGVYSYLPLGLKVINKIADVVRIAMNEIGGQEIQMTALQVKERYQATNRWDDKVVDNWFKTKLANGSEVGLGFSHEENLTPIMIDYINSYKDLPVAPYQIQTKFRNELRSKSGILRGREFLMKDMYTYCLTQEQHDQYYEKIKQAYHKIYQNLGIGDSTFLTFASGGSFSDFSHEFQTLCDSGEDTIYLDKQAKIAINKEVYSDKTLTDLNLNKDKLDEVKAIEVGNIFTLGTKFTKPFEMTVNDQDGKPVTPIMGCYGIGISRLMGVIAEKLCDDRGLVWPENIAPFKVIICQLGDEPVVIKASKKLYDDLLSQGIEVLWDERGAVRPGEKFADADLFGIPHRVVISAKTEAQNKYEYKKRTESDSRIVSQEELQKLLADSS